MPQNATPNQALTPEQLTVLEALLQGRTVTEAALTAGCDRTTVHRWLREDFGFQAAYNRDLREMRKASHARLMRLAEKATAVVEKAIDKDDAKTALAILEGLGLLNGEPLPIGSDNPEELRGLEAERQKDKMLRNMLVDGFFEDKGK